jgi:hypothetical protein
VVSDRAWPARGHPLSVSCQRRLDLDLLDDLSRSKPLDYLQPTQI